MQWISGITALFLTAALWGSEFPIGMHMVNPADDETLNKLKAAGVNYIHTYGTRDSSENGFTRTTELLQRAEKHGMKVWFTLGAKLLLKQNGNTEAVKMNFDRFKTHPAIAGWYLCDEPDGERLEKEMRTLYEYIKKNDPDRPVALVTCWNRYWNKYQDCLDIHMVDHYPVRDKEFPKAKLGNLSSYLERVLALGKPAMPVVQCFSFSAYPNQIKGKDPKTIRYPNAEEIRFMIWSTFAQGVPGIWFYSYYDNVRDKTMKEFDTVAVPQIQELRRFADMVDRPASPETFRFPRDSHFYVGIWHAGQKSYLAAANAWPMESELNGWLENKVSGNYQLEPWGSTKSFPGVIRDGRVLSETPFSPWEVRVWEMIPETK